MVYSKIKKNFWGTCGGCGDCDECNSGGQFRVSQEGAGIADKKPDA